MATAHAVRLQKLRKGLEERSLRGVVLVPGPNMKYLAGVDSLLLERPFMLLVPAEGEIHLVAPALESGPYRRVSVPIEVHSWTDSEGPGGAISEAAKAVSLEGRWGFEG